jgi:hypothetical protein
MATPALAFAQLATECEAEGLSPKNAEKIGHQLAKLFGVKEDEVGILRIEKHNLVFCYPVKLHNVGSIPLNTSSSVAVRTANTRRAEVINNFAQAKHTSVFEAVELSEHKPAAPGAEGETSDHHVHMIQKLMSAPVLGPAGAIGVIQVSRKGTSAPAAGADFMPGDLQKLVGCATALVKCFK